jgi:drug/metabolite transporter (DMT)-like permease
VAKDRFEFVATLIASTFLMGSSFIAGKILLQDGFQPMVLVGWRFMVAAAATLPLVLLHGEPFLNACLPPNFGLRNYSVVLLIGVLQTAAVMGLLFVAMRLISASTAAILLFTNPIWVAAMSRLFLNETLSRNRLLGLSFGITGVVLAIGVNRAAVASPQALAGDAIGLASAFCWAGATIIHRRAKLPMGAWALSFWQMLIGSVVLLAAAYIAAERWPANMTAAQWGWFLWLAIPASTGSFGLWFVALSKAGQSNPSGFLFLAPFFAVALSYFILHSQLNSLQALGGVLIGAAIWLESASRPRSDPPPGADYPGAMPTHNPK